MNPIRAMQDLVQAAFPEARVEVDEPFDPAGAWWMNVFLADYHLAIIWQLGQGFGLAADDDHGFGEGPDEVYPDLKGAVPRVLELLSGKRATEPPPAVRLRELREGLNLSQGDLASRLGRNQASVSRMESRSDLHVSTLRAVAQALDARLVVKMVFADATEKELTFDEPAGTPLAGGRG